ncbi:MFS general substrate transporter [Hypoxylon sp. NC0597]|nr:MFS general substrate transporter [Hypoxylon sp. NC0597]
MAEDWNQIADGEGGNTYHINMSRPSLAATAYELVTSEYTHSWQGVDMHYHPSTVPSHPRDNIPAWKWKVLLVANGFLTIVHGYDVSNVANIQSSIYKAFGHIELLSWVALSNSVCSIALMPLGRKLFQFGDFKTLYLGGILLLIAGSVISGAAPNIWGVIVGRAVVALGSSSIYQGILSFNIIFTYPHELSLVQGSTGACFATGLVLGPLVGGAFAVNWHATWRWSFYLVIPLCVISLVLQALFFPRYRMPTNKSVWTNIKEVDWIGNILHVGVCLLFPISCTFLGSTETWGISSAIATWVAFTVIIITYVLQQAYNIGTTTKNRLLSPCSILENRTVLLSWICTICGAASYGTILNYIPIYFAFNRGLSPFAAAVRLLPFIGVFVFTIVLCGGLLPAVRFYKPFFIAGSVLLLVGGGLLQTLSTNTSEAAVMGFEVVVAAALGILWQLAVPVCSIFLRDTEDRLNLALLSNMATLGGIAFALAIAGMVYQGTGFQSLKDALRDRGFSDIDIHELLAGVDSPVLANQDPEVLRLTLSAITEAIKDCFTILIASGGLSLLAACSMKWEALEFKKPSGQQNPEESENGNQFQHQRSDVDTLLDDLIIQGEAAAHETELHAMTHSYDKRQ